MSEPNTMVHLKVYFRCLQSNGLTFPLFETYIFKHINEVQKINGIKGNILSSDLPRDLCSVWLFKYFIKWRSIFRHRKDCKNHKICQNNLLGLR